MWAKGDVLPQFGQQNRENAGGVRPGRGDIPPPMKQVTPFVVTLAAAFAACHSVPPTPSEAPAPKSGTAVADAPKDEAKPKVDAKKQKQKELRTKERELEVAKIEMRIAEIDRSVRSMGVERALAKTESELAHARSEVDVFLAQVKPRELEEKKIALDQSTYRAEHSKDELGELTAMYEADEFARTTKELVLKRGRRELELAERSLAVVKKDIAHLESVVLPERERALRQKLADAEVDSKKAELDAEKAKIEASLAEKKARDRIADLDEDIAELRKVLAEEKS